jgi:hypothetical protein
VVGGRDDGHRVAAGHERLGQATKKGAGHVTRPARIGVGNDYQAHGGTRMRGFNG